MNIESKPKRKSNARKPRMCYMQLRLPSILKKSTQKSAKNAGMSTNTFIRVLLESVADGDVCVRSRAVQLENAV